MTSKYTDVGQETVYVKTSSIICKIQALVVIAISGLFGSTNMACHFRHKVHVTK